MPRGQRCPATLRRWPPGGTPLESGESRKQGAQHESKGFIRRSATEIRPRACARMSRPSQEPYIDNADGHAESADRSAAIRALCGARVAAAEPTPQNAGLRD